MALRRRGPVVVELAASTLGELSDAVRELELEDLPRDTEVRARIRKAFHPRGGLITQVSGEEA